MKRLRKGLAKLISPDEERPSTSISNQPEASTSREPPKSSSPLTECIFDLCKGCDKLFKPKVQSFLKANGEEWLKNSETRNYLKMYLEKQRDGGSSKSDAEELFELYELCREVLQGEKKIEDNQSEIKDLLFDEEWEDQLANAIENGTINDFLPKVIRVCTIRLEKTEDYQHMREDLKRKI